MLKVSVFLGETARGPAAVPLFGPADSTFEKVAAPTLLSEVSQYIQTLRPRPDAQYVLVNAMGACEYYGSNINGDAFTEGSLIHAPDDWRGVPALDAVKARNWAYGFPTFYAAKPFLHHRNKDYAPFNHPAFGVVELAAWNPRMKRVELVVRVDKDLCERGGGTSIWDKLRAGQYPDVSMGTKVPFDTCSICLDWEAYRKAQATFDPKKDKHPGEAVLAVHKKLIAHGGKGIRGLSITRKDYCEHAAKQMNHIFPDGRKVFVYNDYPRFFDISFVFIGADKTAKVMLKIAGEGRSYWHLNGAELAEKLGYAASEEDGLEKAASADEVVLTEAFGKQAKEKDGEIEKKVVPSQFASKAVPLLTQGEDDLPREMLDQLGSMPLETSLSTSTGLGIVLRPREFQRIVLIRMNLPMVANRLEEKDVVFPKSKDSDDVTMGPEFFHPILARLLLPFLNQRSLLGPAIERRVVVSGEGAKEKRGVSSSLSSALLHKIGAAYNGYRLGIMNLVANAQPLLSSAALPSEFELHKLAQAPVDEVFTPLSVAYIKLAFQDEFGVYDAEVVKDSNRARAGVERELPSRNTCMTRTALFGGHPS